MKKLTALLLILLLILAGCGGESAPTTEPATAPTQPTTEPATEPTTVPTEPTEPQIKFDAAVCAPLFGDWSHQMVLDGELMALPEFRGSQSFDVTWSFHDDGSYTRGFDEEAFQTAISGYEALLIDYMVDSRYRLFVSECNLKGKYSSYIEQEWVTNGLGEQVRTEVTATVEGLQLAQRYAPLEVSGDYYVEDGRLYILRATSGYDAFTFTVEDGVLTLDQSNDFLAYDAMDIAFPLTLAQVVTETPAE